MIAIYNERFFLYVFVMQIIDYSVNLGNALYGW